MTALPPSVSVGYSSGPNSPDYVDQLSKDGMQQINNSKIQQGHIQNPGVILSSDGLDVPLETAFAINDPRTESNRPTLMPLFRTRYVELPKADSSSEQDYQTLRNHLPPDLQAKLTADESLPSNERDPDLIALDGSLRFEAARMTITRYIGTAPADVERAQASTANYAQMPDQVTSNLLGFSGYIVDKLNQHLQELGPNDPSYDMFSGVSNLIKESINLL